MIKFRLYFDKDKEVKWLNEMADKGLLMKGFFLGGYAFEQGQAGAYEYQIDFGRGYGKVSEDYKQFMAEQDIEIVAVWGLWAILRRRKQEKPFELYTDSDSQVEHYTKILIMFKIVTVVEFLISMVLVLSALESGEVVSIIAAILCAAVALVFARIAFHTKQIIRRHRIAEREEAPQERREFSMFLAVGMILNGLVYMRQETITEAWIHPLQILGVALIAVGVYRTMRNR